MFSRIMRPLRLASAKSALDTYLKVLEGASDDERGDVVFSAHTARLRCEVFGAAPVAVFLMPFSLPIAMIDDYVSAIQKLQIKAEKDQDARFSAGLSVWMQSLSGVIFPELRVQSRQLWGMLARGFECAADVGEKLHANSVSDGSALLLAEIMVIPDGLEPRDANGNELAIGMRGSVAIARRAEVLSAAGAARNVAEGQVKQGSPSLPDPTPEPTLEQRRKAFEEKLVAATGKGGS